jgi:hypothetical protein
MDWSQIRAVMALLVATWSIHQLAVSAWLLSLPLLFRFLTLFLFASPSAAGPCRTHAHVSALESSHGLICQNNRIHGLQNQWCVSLSKCLTKNKFTWALIYVTHSTPQETTYKFNSRLAFTTLQQILVMSMFRILHEAYRCKLLMLCSNDYLILSIWWSRFWFLLLAGEWVWSLQKDKH